MADELITRQELIDAKPDVKNLGEAANGNETGIVTPRYGAPYSTAPAAIKKIESDGAAAVAKLENTGGFISAPTLTALQAITPEYDYQLARVDETGDEYRWNPALTTTVKWEATGRNYIQDSKDYTDNEVAAALTTASNDASTKAAEAQENAELYVDLKLVSLPTRSGYVAGIMTSTDRLLIGFRASDGLPVFANDVDIFSSLKGLTEMFDGSIEILSSDRSGVLWGLKTLSEMLPIYVSKFDGKTYIAGMDIVSEIETLKNASSSESLPIFPSSDIFAVGDSLTAGGTTTWTSQLATMSGFQVYNAGIAGQGSRQIAARQGGVPVRFEAFTIPANTSSVVVVPNGNSPCSKSGAAIQITVSGVVGNLLRSSDDVHTFTRLTSGEEVTVAKGTIGIPVIGEQYRNRTLIIGTGRNSFKSGSADYLSQDQLIQIIKEMLDYQHSEVKKAIVWSIPPFPDDTSAQLTQLQNVNNAIKAAFPSQYLDISGWLRTTTPATVGTKTINDPFTYLGITPTTQDLTDIANGMTPLSLRNSETDGHFNAQARTAVAYRFNEELKLRGWL
ncbi:SGNH/GDSL hydrolase family protein [uncultured Acinetobacter sp.]|uniref:SGNH/GDSL hydrolase family protein n=1 Tax=uncultured Acinetobacter sp. TaxID=165433 RepID=UPI00258FDE36|nr:SGNH/GDSL hydrolase family protein [uncultured Acinetobacter sp.]